ncbi:MAG: L-histidine N(alpha)-methyltransferase [Gammaproteobacteria bacterium]|nr:L-histidine N(alpha)-methyltransferase [Gammaproteobacteria bacterium]
MNPRLSLIARPAPEENPTSEFATAFQLALTSEPRRISPKFFYDAAGCELFDQICALPEYYPTRTELGILQRHAHEMAARIGPGADVIEFGAGVMTKIRLLLHALAEPVRYVPVDIAAEHLQAQANLLAADFPGLEVQPLAADFTQGFALPEATMKPRARIGFFPGSSIGNFAPDDARRFLRAAARTLRGGGMLIGVDLVKEPAVLHAAYNDRQGVTAAFNKNLLVRANRELAADFDLEGFDHYAFYNPVASRIEMHLVSNRPQQVTIETEIFEFAPGQTLHTENSYKYSLSGFEKLARQAGFEPKQVWCDEQEWFSVHWLAAPKDAD